MPTYHYACSSCASEFDQYQSFSEDALTVCPTCEGTIRRVIQPVGVVFKGTGWYLTDSRKANEKSAAKASTGDSDSTSSTGDGDKPAKPKTSESGDAKGGGADKKAEPATPKKSVESKATPTAAT